MDVLEIAKVLGSITLTGVMIYIALVLWKAYQTQVNERIKYLEDLAKSQKGADDDKA